MDIQAVIRDLKEERQRLAQALVAMESLTSSENGHRHRGRKFMGEAERQQVSERMKRYWAGRRKAS